MTHWERRVGTWVTGRFHAEMSAPDSASTGPYTPISAWEEAQHNELGAPHVPGHQSSRTMLWAALRARDAFVRGRFDQAARFTKQALQLDPRSPVATRCMGYLRHRSGDLHAVGDFEASLHHGVRLWSRLHFAAHAADISMLDQAIARRSGQNLNGCDANSLANYVAKADSAARGVTESVAQVAANLLSLQVSQRVTNRFMTEIGWQPRDLLGPDDYDPTLDRKLAIWLKYLQGAFRHAEERPKLSIEIPLLRDHGLTRDGASAWELKPGLHQDQAKAPARVAFLLGELALRDGHRQRAKASFSQVVRLAPHVTAGHRHLARIAEASADYRAAPRHYEAACAIPNQHWIAADTSDWMPLYLTRIGGRCDVYRFRGGLYAIDRTNRFRGLAVVADRLIEVFDSRSYRIWSQCGPATRRLMAPLRAPLGKICRASGLDALVSRVIAISVFARLFAAVASILRGKSGEMSRPTGPGRLISIVLAIERRLRGTFLETPAKVFAHWLIVHDVSGVFRSYAGRVKLQLIKCFFDVREVTTENRAQTLEDLIQRLKRRVA